VSLDQQILEYLRTHYFGKYRGTVADNQDATNRGRVKVRVPAVLGGLEVWAMPCVPYAGDRVGFYSLPPPGSGVWVEFEGGDPSYPIWTGCFWADGELPDSSGPDVKVWKTDVHTVRLDDAQAELLLETGGSTLTVSGDGVVSEAGAGKLEVTPASVSVNGGALEVR
jgi:uncharacterized protein involved in type VI secretion and phage assembly